MAEIDWERIRAEYIAGGISCKKLGEKYGISPNVVSKKATKDGWRNDRRKCGEKVAEKIVARSARAKADAALQGLDLCKYTMDLWNMNLKSLNETIQQTPAYMLSNPSFASGIARGLQTTYDLLLKMSGESDNDRKIKNEERKLKIEEERWRIEKKRLETELERKKIELKLMQAEAERAKAGGDGGTIWEIVEDTEGGIDG